MKNCKRIVAPLVLVIAFVATSKVADAGVLAASGAFNGHFYEIYGFQAGEDKNWVPVAIDAHNRTKFGVQGHLATITSAAEDQFLHNLGIASGLARPELWVGGIQRPNQTTPGAGWFWLNGEGAIDGNNAGPNYANWLGGEPNDFPSAAEDNEENFLAIRLGGSFGWNDEGGLGNIGGYVVEYDAVPEPASLAIFGLGSLGLAAGRIRRQKKRSA